MEAILREAANAKVEEDKMHLWAKYLRFWEMMKMLRDTAYINRRDMLNGKHIRYQLF